MRNKQYILTVLLGLLVAFSSCKKEVSEPEIVFPELQTLNTAVGSQNKLSFTVNQPWQLTSSEVWCRFLKDGKECYDLAGVAGQQELTLVISEEQWGNESADKANLVMHCMGKEAIIATVIRAAAGYQLQVFGADGEVAEELVVSYDDYTPFSVKANFRFAATNWPDWAQLKDRYLIGAADKVVESGVSFVGQGTTEMYEQEGTLTLQDELGKASFSVRLVFPGMPRNIVNIIRPDNASAWNWTVSADGKTFMQSGNEYRNMLTFGLSTYHNDCEVVLVEKGEDNTLRIGCDWMRWNHTSRRLTVVENTSRAERSAYVLAFPRETYDNIKDHLLEAISEDGDLAYEVGERNLVVALKQNKAAAKGPETGEDIGFIAESFKDDPDDPQMVKIECYNIVDEAFLNYCESAIGTRNVFLLEDASFRANGMFDLVTPYPYLRYYDDWGDNLAYYTHYDGSLNEDRFPDTSFDDTADPKRWYLSGVSDSREEPDGYFLVMQNRDKSIMKALFIKTNK